MNECTSDSYRESTLKLDDLPKLNLYDLTEKGRLAPGQFEAHWHYFNCSVGIEVMPSQEAIILRYTVNGERIKQPIQITRSSNPVGNFRPLFVCPECGGRRYKLYLYSRFMCAPCTGLLYRCQVEEPQDKALRRAQKLRRKLKAASMTTGTYVPRPKHMSHETYFRLKAELDQLEAQALAPIRKQLSRR